MDLKEQSITTKESRHPWEIARAKCINSLLKNYINSDSPIFVDFGCGDLFFLDYTLANHPNANGIGFDIGFNDKDLQAFNKRYNRLEAVNNKKSLDELLSQKEVDVVFLMDVIEHVENDVKILKSIIDSDWFGPKSRLIITVPAFQSLFNSHDVFLEHYRRYTNSSLQSAATTAGYDIELKGYFFSSLLLPRTFNKIKESISPPQSVEKSELVNWNGGKLLTNSIANVLYADYKVNYFFNSKIGLRLPGLSNYMVCKIPA